jgi:hypothetical protein
VNNKKIITAEKEKEIVDRLTKPRMNRFCECCAHKYGGGPHIHHSKSPQESPEKTVKFNDS